MDRQNERIRSDPAMFSGAPARWILQVVFVVGYAPDVLTMGVNRERGGLGSVLRTLCSRLQQWFSETTAVE
jgi:hypothetical protein